MIAPLLLLSRKLPSFCHYVHRLCRKIILIALLISWVAPEGHVKK